MKVERLPDKSVKDILVELRKPLLAANLLLSDTASVILAHKAVAGLAQSISDIVGNRSIVAQSAEIIGSAEIGQGCVIGPMSSIGPFSFLKKNSIIFEHVTIGHGVEINSSVIFDGAKISHLSFIGTSSVGCDSNIGAGAITATSRLDGRGVLVRAGNLSMEAMNKYHGSVIGANARLGVRVTMMPGTTVLPNSMIRPNAVISGFIKKDA